MTARILSVLTLCIPLCAESFEIPASFEQNKGQWGVSESLRFAARTHDYTVQLGDGAIRFVAPGEIIAMTPENGGRLGVPKGEGQQQRLSNYLVRKPEITGVPHFDRAVYRDVWPGIDLVFRIEAGSVEFDLQVAPHADRSKIAFRFPGAGRFAHGADGSLDMGAVRLRAPKAHQEKEIAVAFEVSDGLLRFRLGAHDSGKALTIDPVVESATAIGGLSHGVITRNLTTDSAGNVYLCGYTATQLGVVDPFPATPGAFRRTKTASIDLFVMKLAQDAKTIVYATYLNFPWESLPNAIGVDSAGNVVVAGSTRAPNFPVSANAFQVPRPAPLSMTNSDAFVFKLNATGSQLLFSNYFGGSAADSVAFLSLDPAGNIYLAGGSSSTNMPTTPGVLKPASGAIPAQSAISWTGKINPAGTTLHYLTYVDGQVWGIAAEATGAALIAGVAYTPVNFPTTAGAYRTAHQGGSEAFVTRINATGTAITESTFVGGSGTDYFAALQLDGAGGIYLAGETYSPDFPATSSAKPPGLPRSTGGVLVKMNNALSAIVQATTFGGANFTNVRHLAVAPDGTAFVSGHADSVDFVQRGEPWIAKPGRFDPSNPSPFLVRIAPTGEVLDMSFAYGTRLPPPGVAATEPYNVIESLAAPSGNLLYLLGGFIGTNYPSTSIGLPSAAENAEIHTYVSKLNFNSPCTYSVSPSTVSLPVGGGEVTVTVTTQPGCEFTASANDNWIDASRSSATTARIAAAASSLAGQSGYAFVAGKTIPVAQGNQCLYAADFATIEVPAAGGIYRVAPITFPSCQWTPVWTGSFLTDVSGLGAVRTGPDQALLLRAAPNSSSSPRTSSITLASGVVVTLRQAATACTFTVSPSEVFVGSAAQEFTVNVATSAGCAWDASSSSNFISPLPVRNTGSMALKLAIAASTVTTRTGTILVAGKTINVTQAQVGAWAGPTLQLISGGGQRVRIGAGFPKPVRVRLTDAQGQPMSGVLVGFQAPVGGPSVREPAGSVITDSVGIATLPLNANTIPGAYSILVAHAFATDPLSIPAENVGIEMISPAPGSVLSTRSVLFTWNRVFGDGNYQVFVRDLSAGADLVQGQVISNSAILVTNMPCAPSVISVTMLHLSGSPLFPAVASYYFTTSGACAAENRAILQSPAPGSTLGSPNTQFTWNAPAGALDYWLDVGTSLGQGDISAGVVAGTSKTVNGIECNGTQLFVRLWTRTSGGYQPPIDTVLLAPTNCGAPSRAQLAMPAAGSTIGTRNVSFAWREGEQALDYWFDLGTSRGIGNVSAGVVAGTTKTVVNVNCTGQPLWVRLWTRTASGYLPPFDYSFPTSSSCSSDEPTLIVNPLPDSVQTPPVNIFTLRMSPGIIDHTVSFGTNPGAADLGLQTASSAVVQTPVFNCPAGNYYYVRVQSRNAAGQLPFTDYRFRCNTPAAPFLTSPAPNTQFTGSSVTFTWQANTPAWLDIGTSAGQGNLFAAHIAGNSRTVDFLPCTGQTIYARLIPFVSGKYQVPQDFSFTSANGCPGQSRAALVTPTANARLTSPAQSFNWTTPSTAEEFWLDVGTARGLGNIHGKPTTSNRADVTGVPCAGQTVFVRLWTKQAGNWLSPIDYQFTCQTENSNAVLLSPEPGSQLDGAVTFRWSPGAGAQDYWLDVGTAKGSGNISGGVVNGTSKQVGGIPGGNVPVWVRLWTRINGVWQSPIDYQFTSW